MRKWHFGILAVLLISACADEEFFGLSPFGEIKTIEVTNQASQATINSGDKTVFIEFPSGVDLTSNTIQTLTLSSFATSDRQVGDVIDLTDSAVIVVTAEDKVSVTTWTIYPQVATTNPQLPNSDFNAWFQTNEGYYEPGADAASTIWGTGNGGTKILGLFPTTPLEVAKDNYASRMETLYNGPLAESFGTPISAGSIYTGKFNPDDINLSDPAAAIDFGTPFAGRPNAYKLKYSYIPGEENKDRNGNILSYGDACDIYLLLEVRTGDNVRRLATGWFRSEEEVAEATDLEVDLIYGELPANAPEYAKPENGKYVGSDSSAFVLPTHLTFVASSSFDGNNFGGAVGSLLIIDDLELVYE